MNDVLKTREMAFLDACRSKECVDDILVHLTCEGLETETHYVKITGLGDRWFIGNLLEEPEQDFGVHVGDEIPFFAQQLKDGSVICFSNLTPDKKFTKEELADGKLLDQAIMVFNQRHNEESLVEVLQVLRDADVIVPCKDVADDGSVNPQLLLNQDKYFFPIFSNEAALGNQAEGMPTVVKNIFEVIEMANKEELEVTAIVVNAFTEVFVLNPDLWPVVQSLESRIG